MPNVAVVIPVRDRAGMVVEAIASVLASAASIIWETLSGLKS